MKKILTILILFISLKSFGQSDYLHRNTKERLRALKADSTIHIPVGSGAPSGATSLRGGFTGAGALYYDSVGNKLYSWDYTSGWRQVTGSGGGGGISEVIAGYGLLNDNDSTLKVDSAFIETKLDSRRKTDSLLDLILARIKYSDSAAMLANYRHWAAGYITTRDRFGVLGEDNDNANAGTLNRRIVMAGKSFIIDSMGTGGWLFRVIEPDGTRYFSQVNTSLNKFYFGDYNSSTYLGEASIGQDGFTGGYINMYMGKQSSTGYGVPTFNLSGGDSSISILADKIIISSDSAGASYFKILRLPTATSVINMQGVIRDSTDGKLYRYNYSLNPTLQSVTNAGPSTTNSIAIGTSSAPDASAVVDMVSTTKGFLMPRMTYAERNAIGTPATGLKIYNTQTNKFNWYNGSAWRVVGDSADAGGASGIDDVLAIGQQLTANRTIDANGNNLTFSNTGDVTFSRNVNGFWSVVNTTGGASRIDVGEYYTDMYAPNGNGAIIVYNDTTEIYLQSTSSKLLINNLASQHGSDTTNWKIEVYNPTTDQVKYMTYWPAGGTPTLQQVLTSGNAFNNNSIDVGEAGSILWDADNDGDFVAQYNTNNNNIVFQNNTSGLGTIFDISIQTALRTLKLPDASDTIANRAWVRSLISGGSGTVTDFIFTDANGFDGTVSTSTTTPTLSLTTTVTDDRLMISNSGAISGDANLTYSGSQLVLGTSANSLNVFRMNALSGSPAVQMGTYTGFPNYGTINLGNATATTSNYTLASDGTTSILNAPTGGTLDFRINHSTTIQAISSSNILNNVQTQHELQAKMREIAAPSTPASGYAALYVKSDGLFYGKADDGIETQLSNRTGNLTTNVTDVGNITTGVDDLMTYSIPAGQLATNGDYLEFTMTFDLAANANSKQIRVVFGATTVYASGAQAQNDGVLEIKGTIIRTGATTQRITFSQNNNTTLFTDYADYVTAGETLSGAVTLKATGEGVATDDIIQKILVVKYVAVN